MKTNKSFNKKDYFYSKINNKLFEKLNEDINQPSPSTFRFSEFNSINNHYYPIKRNSKSNLLLNQKPKSIHHLTSPNSISTTNIYSKSKIRKQIHKTENNFNTNNIIINNTNIINNNRTNIINNNILNNSNDYKNSINQLNIQQIKELTKNNKNKGNIQIINNIMRQRPIIIIFLVIMRIIIQKK